MGGIHYISLYNYEQSGIKQQNGNLGFTLQYFHENMDTHYLHRLFSMENHGGFPYLFSFYVYVSLADGN